MTVQEADNNASCSLSRQRRYTVFYMNPLGELLATSDIVSLHVPQTAETQHMMNAASFAQMKHGSVLINTARGGLVDEAALIDALNRGQLGGAALDVFACEPLPHDHPLLSFPNVILTPHIAAGTRDALTAKMQAVFANLERFAKGEPLRNTVVDRSAITTPGEDRLHRGTINDGSRPDRGVIGYGMNKARFSLAPSDRSSKCGGYPRTEPFLAPDRQRPDLEHWRDFTNGTGCWRQTIIPDAGRPRLGNAISAEDGQKTLTSYRW